MCNLIKKHLQQQDKDGEKKNLCIQKSRMQNYNLIVIDSFLNIKEKIL